MFISHLGTVGFDILLKDFCVKGKKRERTKENKSNETEYIVKHLSLQKVPQAACLWWIWDNLSGQL